LFGKLPWLLLVVIPCLNAEEKRWFAERHAQGAYAVRKKSAENRRFFLQRVWYNTVYEPAAPMGREGNEALPGLFEQNEFDTFTAVDVETPNRYSRSICSIGIVRVDSAGEPVRLHYLVNPCDEFDVANIAIHGIRPADVESEPSLYELWPTIEPYFTGCLLVAHNALFDLPVIRKALLRENLFAENWRYVCTLEKSRRHIPKTTFGSHRLNDLCAGLGISLEHHHNALDDALACATLYEYLRTRYGVSGQDVKVYR
jgi:DNA polymerase III subunit epsilon